MTDAPDLSIREYCDRAATTAEYREGIPSREMVRRDYALMGLAGEVGSLLDEAKKIMRDDGGALTPARRERVHHLLGGVLWYWAAVNFEMVFDPAEVAQANLDVLADRAERGVIHGDGWRR